MSRGKNQQAVTVEQRKIEELQTYEAQYQAGRGNSSDAVRSRLLGESEAEFSHLVEQRCANKRVLEIGCGDGSHAVHAARCGAEVWAVDISAAAIALAQERAARAGVADRIHFAVMDVEELEFPDNFFDVVLNHEVFSSVDLSLAVGELVRVMNIGGILLGKETFGHNPLFNAQRKLKVLLGKRTAWAASHIFCNDDMRLLSAMLRPVSQHYYHCFVLAAAPCVMFPHNRLALRCIAAAQALDRVLFSQNIFRRLAFKVVFEYQRAETRY